MSTKKNRFKANYPCSQQSLYTVAALVWANYNANIAKFTSLKGKYTPLLGSTAIAEIAAAKLLPDSPARNAIPETIRIALLPLGKTCLANQRILNSYIEEAFPATAATMIAAAGYRSYPDAHNEGWEEMNVMINEGALFITTNKEALEMTSTNMPVTFIATYNSGKTAFETLYNNYLSTAQATHSGATDKMKANNAVYTTLRTMLNDGQLIFENDETKKALFIFDKVLSGVTGNGTTGMRITVVNSASKVNIINFTVSVQPGDQIATAEGVVLELKMQEELYTVIITAPGYSPLTMKDIQLKTGIMHRLDVELKKII